jgi:tellurite resistance protein TerC
MHNEPFLWVVFAVVVVIALGVDLLVFHKKEHKVKMKEALIWSAVWIS